MASMHQTTLELRASERSTWSPRRIPLRGASLALLVWVFLLSGIWACGPRRAVKPESRLPNPEALLASLRGKDALLMTFKALGRVRLTTGGRRESYRTAWLGSGRDRLRVELLNPFRQPMAVFAANGESFFFDARASGQFLTGRPTAKNIGRFLGVPLSVEDLVLLLSGRIPLAAHHRAEVSKWEPDESGDSGGYVLALKGQWGGVRQRIWFDAGTNEPVRAVFWGALGAKAYGVEFGPGLQVGGMEIPRSIRVTVDSGAEVEITIERFWPNAPVDNAAFRLETPPGVQTEN